MRKVGVAVALLAVIGAVVLWRSRVGRGPSPPPTVSRETTWLTEPLRPDGTIDYAAALDAEWGRGVTPENNAAPVIARIVGGNLERFTAEELAAAPEVEWPLVDFDAWHDRRRRRAPDGSAQGVELDAMEVFDAAWTGGLLEPGHAQRIDEWLEEHEEALDRAPIAAARPRLFVRSGGTLFGRAAMTAELSELAVAVALRARRAADRGEPDRAWRELDVAMRLVALAETQPIPAEQVDAARLRRGTWECARTIAAVTAGVPTAALAALGRHRSGRSAMTAIRAMLQPERFGALEGVLADARGFSAERLIDPGAGPRGSAAATGSAKFRLDRDAVCRRLNEWFDRLDAAVAASAPGSISSVARQLAAEARAAFESALNQLFRRAVSVADLAAMAALQGLADDIAWILASHAHAELIHAQLAAESFARSAGRDPATSDDLTPALFADPLRDTLLGEPFRFERTPGGRLRARSAIEALDRE